MKIVILGGGQVGSPVAEQLAAENHDITVVDHQPEVLGELGERADLRTVTGHACYPQILEEAGMAAADMVLAVTAADEVNMVACQMAESLFHTPTKLARLRAQEYLTHPELFNRESFPVDHIISPEKIVTDYILRIIEQPGALQVMDFAQGRVRLVGVRADRDGPLVGHQLRDIGPQERQGHDIRANRRRVPFQRTREGPSSYGLPILNTRVAAIYRGGQAIIPEGDTVIEEADEVFFIAAREKIQEVLKALRSEQKAAHQAIIVGGGRIGGALAQVLEHSAIQVKVIESHRQRAAQLAAELGHTLVLQGDGTDEELLREENIRAMDLFVAVTNDDEANILSSMLAKQLGVSRVITLIKRGAYVDLIQRTGIDVAVSPTQGTIGRILAHVRRGDVAMVHSLRRGAAEAIEVLVHGDSSTSRVVGRRLDELRLPNGVSVGAIIRGNEVKIAHHDVVIQPDDHVILFVVDKKRIAQVEKLFEVGLGYL